MAKRKTKTRTVAATKALRIPRLLAGGQVGWAIRVIVPNFPFFLDSKITYVTEFSANKELAKWRDRKISVTTKQ